MTDVAVIGFAQAPGERHSPATTNGVEMLVPIFGEIFAATGLTKDDIGFWCSGSSDYLAGRAFSFVSAVDAIGAFPPVMESHVEMDGAWALYEAWLKILTGEAEIALAYGFGKSSAGDLRRILALQLDPRSEEHTSELQSPCNLVCRLLLEKKKNESTRLRLKQKKLKQIIQQ